MSQAMCSFSGIWCWPLSKTIRPNGIIMVEFYAYSQEIVPGLQSKYPIYLKAGDEFVTIQDGEHNNLFNFRQTTEKLDSLLRN